MAVKISFPRRAGRSADPEKPISETGRTGTMSRGCGLFFFGIFLITGAAATWFLGVRPVMKVFEARSWPELQCTVTSSQVETHSGDDGNTYSVDIRYRYEVDGRTYTGDRYNFMPGSSSGYDSKAAIVERYPPSTRFPCRVDPDDPEQSVINVGFDLGYLWGLFGLPFLLVGLFGTVWMLRRPKPRKAGREWLPRAPDGSGDPELSGFSPTGPLVLSSVYRPVWRFLGLLVFAGIWNAMVVFLLWPLSQSEGGCVWVFLVVFGLVGLLLLISVPHSFLAMFNPRPTLTLDTARLVLGEPCRVSWHWSGATRRIERLEIHLEGQEEATYRRGTDTHTDKHVFAKIDLVDTRTSMEISRSTAELAIPADTMHSFEASNNRIVWRLKMSAEIPRWPDVAEEHKVVILFDSGSFRKLDDHPPLPPEERSLEPTSPEDQPLAIEPEDGKTSFRPGETVSGVVRWELDEDPTEVVLRLFWFTEGRGTRDVEVVASEPFEAPGIRERRSFSFRLPEGPYSFSGKLISLIWALELVADPGDRTARRMLTLGPEGREVRLGSVEEEAE